ncbi:hypothetical protein RAS2_28530 [Phycisphaerae bacterium RAS2]|nr:hypothetical protein RAS2_28530 [Phycisphaerae bacterium RAS2]
MRVLRPDRQFPAAKYQQWIASVIAIQVLGPAVKADNFWHPLNGPTGGSIYALVQDATTGNLFAGTGYQHGYNRNAGSVFRSSDNGAHWSYVSADFFDVANPINTRVRGLAVSNTGIIFAGLEGAGVFRSTNGGTSWSPFNTALGDLSVRAVAVSPLDEVYAATATGGVFRLVGANWSADNIGLTNLAARAFAFGPGYLIVGTAGGGVFKRITGGNWINANSGLTDFTINGLYASPGGTRLLACTNAGLFESNDHAATWHALVGPFTGTTVWSAVEIGTSILLGTATGMFVSDSTGSQWTTATNGYTGTVCRTLLNDGLGNVFSGSFHEGVFRSTDGAQSWTQQNDGLYGRTVLRLVVSSRGYVLAGTNSQGVFRSDVLGATWSGPNLPTRSIFALNESPWGDLFAGNYTILPSGVPDGHAWRSSDDGENWAPLDNGPIPSMVSGFAFPSPQQVICSTAWGVNSVRTSTNNGDQWTQLSPGPGNEAYCLTRNSAGDLFIGSEGHGVLRYNAAAQTWTNLGLATLSQQFSIAINSQGHVFVGNDGNIKGVYKSTNNGDALSPLGSFPSNYGYVIVCLPNDDLYVGTRDVGIQHSNDGGASWSTVNSGLPVKSCQAMTLGPDGHLYAGVAGFGVYRSALPLVSQTAGDIDGDGDVDELDIAIFVNVLLAIDTVPIHVLRSDVSRDGMADGGDVAGFVAACLGS